MSSLYLKRYAWPEPVTTGYETYSQVEMAIVIPCYNEPDISKALNSLQACFPPNKGVLVLVIVNEPENTPAAVALTNKKTVQTIENFKSWYRLEAVHLRLPEKKAGVGLARKIGMDEAVRIFEAHHKNGIIVCYDADCTCEKNYLIEIEKYYQNKKNHLGLVYYEHPLDGKHPEAILVYELFLRHYIDGLRYVGFPHSLQTLGSCITVRSGVYQKQGGMNTRKAGEDFYFIHKVVPLGGVGEINQTCVYPSDRTSDRVPFGTGHAINQYFRQPQPTPEVYAPQIFEDLKSVFSSYNRLYDGESLSDLNLPESILRFYKETNFASAISKILNQSNNVQNFHKRFFAWWDAFRVLKFVHFARDHFYPNIPVAEGTDWLGSAYLKIDFRGVGLKERLDAFRKADRDSNYYIK